MENAELGRLALKQIDTFPDTFSMSTWGIRTECGTVACLAGHAMLCSGYEEKTFPQYRMVSYIRPDGAEVLRTLTGHRAYGDEAQELLGMSKTERYGCPCPLRPGCDDDIFLDMGHGLERFRRLLEE
jgi:hypothetical protein